MVIPIPTISFVNDPFA
jgi:hypothetical protein